MSELCLLSPTSFPRPNLRREPLPKTNRTLAHITFAHQTYIEIRSEPDAQSNIVFAVTYALTKILNVVTSR